VPNLVIGDTAPEFALSDLAGVKHRLRNGPWPTVLTFIKSSCWTCQFTAPFLQRLRQAIPEQAARMLAVMQDEQSAADEFVRRYGLSMTALLEPEPWAVSSAYGLESGPDIFLVESDGRISSAFTAFQRDELARLAGDLGRRAGLSGEVDLFEGADVPRLRPG